MYISTKKFVSLVFLTLIVIIASVLMIRHYYSDRSVTIVENEVIFSRFYSVMKGNDLKVYYNFPKETVGTLYRLGKTKEKISTYQIPAAYQKDVRFDFVKGLNIETSFPVKTSDLTSGYYIMQGTTPSGHDFAVPFVVADQNCSGIAVVSSTNTWAAYNDYVRSNYQDGRPAYYLFEDKLKKIIRRLFAINAQERYLPAPLPWKRPSTFAVKTSHKDFAREGTGSHLLMLEWQLVTALEEQSVPYCVLDDRLFAFERYYEKHNAFIFNGHSEYWSKRMMNQLDQLLVQNKKILFSGGNNIYREVEFNEHSLNVVRQRIDEELTAPRIGAYYDDRGFATYAPMKILTPDHWVFEGVTHTVFGEKSAYSDVAMKGGISGHETDKVSPYSTGFSVLARGQNHYATGGADMVYRELGDGWVLNFASLSFIGGYFVDDDVKTILQNVFAEMQK